jgi:uncharacterized OsmC-like protein
VRRLLTPALAAIDAAGEAEVQLAGRSFRIRKQFLDDLASHPPAERISALRKALLILHSPRDTIVSIDNAAQIFMAARHPKSFVSLDDADHMLTRTEDAVYVAAVLSAWASRYVKGASMPAALDTPADHAGVTVSEVGVKLTQAIHAGRHRLQADEPLAFGGLDAGPSPYDLLLAGLGACTSMTLRLYASQKQWPLAGIEVRLKHDKIHAADCAECETREGRIDRIEREISITGPLDETQRQRLLEIANRCPVHRTLHSEVVVPTRLAAE